MSVVARFFVSQVSRFAYSQNAAVVELMAVSRGPENKTWASATPQGKLTMTINNGSAGGWFADRLGKDVVLTFEAPEDDADHLSPHG